MEHNLIAWNIPNWITVILMVSLGYLLLALVAQGFQRMRGGAGGQLLSFPSGKPLAG
jgi:hypothetical protein